MVRFLLILTSTVFSFASGAFSTGEMQNCFPGRTTSSSQLHYVVLPMTVMIGEGNANNPTWYRCVRRAPDRRGQPSPQQCFQTSRSNHYSLPSASTVVTAVRGSDRAQMTALHCSSGATLCERVNLNRGSDPAFVSFQDAEVLASDHEHAISALEARNASCGSIRARSEAYPQALGQNCDRFFTGTYQMTIADGVQNYVRRTLCPRSRDDNFMPLPNAAATGTQGAPN